jgi:gluconolactonase
MRKHWCLLLLFTATAAFSQPVPPGAVLEKLRTGFLQPEGPVWIDSLGILFSDIKADKIYRWSPVGDTLTTYLYPSDSSNGLTLDLQGRLILTQMAERRVSRRETNGTITPLASTYKGRKFNSPNDLVVKSDGSIFFTDPDFNTPLGQTKEMGFKGVFRISPYGGIYALDSTTFDKPNGICFSPNELKLYVNESPLRRIYVWDVVNDSTIANRQLFYTVPGVNYQDYADGMKVDPDGNLYCTSKGGVWIISPAGICIDTIVMTDGPSNCNWGNADRKTLYITAGTSLYRINLAPAVDVKGQGYLPSKTFELYSNYPNPFNPYTKINYKLPGMGTQYNVFLQVYDVLGRAVETLVDDIKESGSYSVTFNAENLPSGVYFYKLQAGSFSQSKKMILSK